MAIGLWPERDADTEADAISRARRGEEYAFDDLIAPWQKPLSAYIYRIVAHYEDSQDLLQDLLIRALELIPSYPERVPLRIWLFQIATGLCMDHVRRQWRWRTDAHLIAESEESIDQETLAQFEEFAKEESFAFEPREHVAFCFSSVARSLPAEEQIAVTLTEVFGFSNEDCAQVMRIPAADASAAHASGRSTMIGHYKGMCALINGDGRCVQCLELQDWSPPEGERQGLEEIEPSPGTPANDETLFDARMAIVREADLENGPTARLHRWFYDGLTHQEGGRG